MNINNISDISDIPLENRLVTYGTLRPGGGLSNVVENYYVKHLRGIIPNHAMYSLGICPGIKPGTVYQHTAATLYILKPNLDLQDFWSTLDQIEASYNRTVLPFYIPNLGMTEAYVYVYNYDPLSYQRLVSWYTNMRHTSMVDTHLELLWDLNALTNYEDTL